MKVCVCSVFKILTLLRFGHSKFTHFGGAQGLHKSVSALLAILHACSVCEFVTAYGFTIADKTINGTTTLKLWHYYSHPDDASMLPVKNQPHKFHQEREVLQRLQILSLIKMRSPRSR